MRLEQTLKKVEAMPFREIRCSKKNSKPESLGNSTFQARLGRGAVQPPGFRGFLKSSNIFVEILAAREAMEEGTLRKKCCVCSERHKKLIAYRVNIVLEHDSKNPWICDVCRV